MFERFTERARQVVVLAQEEARVLRHNWIGTEHILLGLLREDEGLAARVLESLDVTLERVRGEVVRIVGSGEEVTSGQIPFTPRAKKVLELALREALSLGHDYIGTEHILLGLARESEGVATRILLDFGVDAERVRAEVIRMLSGPRRGPEAPVETRLDTEAALAMELARREAASLGQDQVGPEHLLLGLQLSGGGLAAAILQDLGVTIERARPLLIEIAGSGEPVAGGEIPLTPAAENVLWRARQEALNLGARSVSTEHILLSLAHSYEGALGRILLDLDTSPQQIRHAVRRRILPGPAQVVRRRYTLAAPGLDWRRANLLWRPEGLELRVGLRMNVAQMAAFAADPIWEEAPLAGLRREIWTGWLALASPTLLEDVGDAAALRRSLDGAARRALDAGEADGARVAAFLSELRTEPEPPATQREA